jgi:molybdopterin molybdotransferase
MVSVEEAQKLVLDNTNILESVEVSLTEAEGLILAEDITSPVNLPYFTNSAMDGYAVKSRDTKEANENSPVSLKVVGIIRAGDYPNFTVGDKEAAKIMTGAPLPSGVDAVVMVEYTEEGKGIVKVKKAVNPSENIRYEGEEIKKGEIALEKGTELNPASIGFIAGLGIKKVKVYRKPKVALVVTGEEVVGLDEELKPGKIRDTNSITLSATLSREKVEFLFLGRARDELSDIEEKLKRGVEWCDVLIVTGGVSIGDYDYVKDVLEDLGVEEIFWRVAQRPGGPVFFGKRGDTLIFGLPGNPASALLCLYEYVRPALRKMMGKRDVFLMEIEAMLLEEIRKKPDGKTHFLRGHLEKEGDSFYVKSSGTQGSHILKSFALSNCLIIVPGDITHLPSGSRVKVHILLR